MRVWSPATTQIVWLLRQVVTCLLGDGERKWRADDLNSFRKNLGVRKGEAFEVRGVYTEMSSFVT